MQNQNRKVLLDQTDSRTQYAYLGYGDRADDLTVETVYHHDEGLSLAKAMKDSEQARSKEFRLAAIIPEDVLERSMREGWFQDNAAWKRWANDPDNKHWRVWEGRL